MSQIMMRKGKEKRIKLDRKWQKSELCSKVRYLFPHRLFKSREFETSNFKNRKYKK